jgi:hypothetical protein
MFEALKAKIVVVCLVAALAVGLVLGFGVGYWWVDEDRDDAVTALADYKAEQEAKALEAAKQLTVESERRRQAETTLAATNATIGQQYQEDLQNAKTSADGVLADLRAGNVRLRNELAGCQAGRGADADASRRELDAAAELRNEIASRIVRVGADADAQVKGLQRQLEADRAAFLDFAAGEVAP